MPTNRRTRKDHRRAFGQVSVLPSGRFRVRFTAPDGSRRTGPSTFATRTEAEGYLVQVQAELLRGNTLAVVPTTTPLGQYLTDYLRTTAPGLRASTLDLYQRTAATWITRPVGAAPRRIDLGALALSAITTGTVREWHAAVVAQAHTEALEAAARTHVRRTGHPARAWAATQGMPVATTGKLPAEVLTAWHAAGEPAPPAPEVEPHAGRTAAAQAYRLLRSVLAQAVRDGLIPTNPAQVKGAATAPHPERLPLDPPAVAALAEAVPARYRAAVLVAAWSGMRPGEVFALRRADVGADGAVQVARTLVEISGRPITTGPPKNAAGRRTVTLPATVAAALTEHLGTYTGPDPEALVFTRPAGGPVHAAARSRMMRPARQKIDRPDLTWHHLRHTGATLAAITGATQAELQRRIGHSTTRAAALYQHATTTRDQWIATQLDTLTTPTPPNPEPTESAPRRRRHLRVVHSA